MRRAGIFVVNKTFFSAIKIICKGWSQLRAKFYSCCIAKKRVNTSVILNIFVCSEIFRSLEYVDADFLAYNEERI